MPYLSRRFAHGRDVRNMLALLTVSLALFIALALAFLISVPVAMWLAAKEDRE